MFYVKKTKHAKEIDGIDKAWTAIDAPDFLDGVALTELGKKNWVKLQALNTRPTPRNCANCGTPLDWRTNGQLRLKGKYYQSNCHNGCHKDVVNDKVFSI